MTAPDTNQPEADCRHDWREISESDTPCPLCAAIAAESAKLPDRIWLQFEADGEVIDEHGEGRTWCQDKINDSDVEYVRVSAPSDASALVEALLNSAAQEDAVCLAHAHANRVDEALCSLRFQRDQAIKRNAALVEALREATDMREQRDAWVRAYGKAETEAEQLRGALREMVDEKADYMRINHLGDPEAQHSIIRARAALAQHGAKP